MSTRVVVTGLGALSPLGNDVKSTWDNLVKGVSGASEIKAFDASKFKTQFACQINGFDPAIRLSRAEIKRNDLYAQYGIYAATEAFEDSGLDMSKEDPFDVGVIWGSGQGGMLTLEQEMKAYVEGGMQPRFNPFLIPKYISNMAAGMISIKHGLMGVNFSTVSACATANTSMMDAFNYIRLGKAKAIVVGASDSPITEASIGGFNALKALSIRNDSPETASRPFDVTRDGFVMGEGAAALILEDYDHAIARGAKIYAEFSGAAMTGDAYHMTATHPEGLGASEAMKRALAEGGFTMNDVDYVNAHATSTPVGDLSEVEAISRLVGEGKQPLVGGTKSMTGHLLGAAGAIEAVFCVKAIQEGIVPPTMNTKALDPGVPANVKLVLGEAVKSDVHVALSNSFGFGGHNASVVFSKAE